ncbi:MAG: hypothetical protein ABI534_05765 [Chloroflexota bacterium]
MSRPLVGLLIAVLATFVAAPSTSFAAANTLSAAVASPTSGSAGTVVSLAVDYDGAHPASSISASLGTLSVTLTLGSGTASAGRWTGVAAPPPGTWTVRFTARAAQGPATSLDGPTVTILAVAPVPGISPKVDAAPRTSEPISDGAAGEDGSGGSGGAQAPAVTPLAIPASPPAVDPIPPTTTQPLPAASASAAPAVPSEDQPPSAPAPRPADTSRAPDLGPAGARPASSAFDVAPSQRGAGSASPLPAAELAGGDTWTLPTVMSLAVTLACLLAIAGVGMLVAGRRRQETATAAMVEPGVSAPEADDPIVAAMGIAPETALLARRARRLRDSMDERAARGVGPIELDPPRAQSPARLRGRRAPKR